MATDLKTNTKKKSRWSLTEIEAIKDSISKYLVDKASKGVPPRELIDILIKKINELESDLTSQGTLSSLLYIIAMLHIYKRVKIGTKDKRIIEKASDYAHKILVLNGVAPSNSKFSFLYGELYQVRSAIFMSLGQNRNAAIEYLLGLHLSGKSRTNDHSLEYLSMGIRSLNLGNGIDAIHYLKEATLEDLSLANQIRLNSSLLKAYRLAAKISCAEELAASIEASPLIKDEYFQSEFIWEQRCRMVFKTGDVKPLIDLTSEQAFFTESYLLEIILYAYCAKERTWIQRVPKTKTLANKGIRRVNSARFQVARMFEELYDPNVDLTIRIRRLCDFIGSESRDVVNISLLTMVAAARWSLRFEQPWLARFCLREYQTMGYRLSDGKNCDPLGIAKDIAISLTDHIRPYPPSRRSI